jgi:DNA-binding PadR family transcriptional regulator
MNEPRPPRRGRGKTKKDKTAEAADPLSCEKRADTGRDAPVELEDIDEHRFAQQRPWPGGEIRERDEFDEDDRLVEWESDYDEDPGLEVAYDEEDEEDQESEFESDYDEESEFEPGYHEESVFEPGEGSEHEPGRHPGPRLAPGPKHGPGHPPGPHHAHGPGPKKVPGKKAPAKKIPAKKVPGPKKHPGHPPPPPHEHEPGHPPPPPHEQGREHGRGAPGAERGFGFGPGPGWGYGPGPDFGFGFGSGPGARTRRRGSRPGRRVRPGDVRAAILALLAEGPMHGYEMIQEIAERTQDLWRPSPGSVYPTLQLLEDERLIVGSESEGSTKLFELTDEGRAAAENIKTPPWERIAGGVDSGQAALRAVLAQLVGAVAQTAYATTADEQQRILAILKSARRQIYTLLAESE